MTDSEEVRWGQQHASVPPPVRPPGTDAVGATSRSRWLPARLPLQRVCWGVSASATPAPLLDVLPTTHSSGQGLQEGLSHRAPGGGGEGEQSLQPWGAEEKVRLHLSFHLNTVIWFLFRNNKKANPTTTAFSPFFYFVTYPSLASSLLLTALSYSGSFHSYCLVFFFFLRNLTSTCLFFFFLWVYILYIYKLYTHTHVWLPHFSLLFPL